MSELNLPIGPTAPRDPRTEVRVEPPAYGRLTQGVEHVAVPGGLLTSELLGQAMEGGPDHLVVTPWRSVLTVNA